MEYQSKDNRFMTKSEFKETLFTETLAIEFVNPTDGQTYNESITLNEDFYADDIENSRTNERSPSNEFNAYTRKPEKFLMVWSMTAGGWRPIQYTTVSKISNRKVKLEKG